MLFTLSVGFAATSPKGEQRENATVWRFLEAKSSPQGVEGEGYAPTRNDYVAGQGASPTKTCAPHLLRLPPRNIPSRVILSEPPGESNFCGMPQKRCGL